VRLPREECNEQNIDLRAAIQELLELAISIVFTALRLAFDPPPATAGDQCPSSGVVPAARFTFSFPPTGCYGRLIFWDLRSVFMRS
jgi:hypothetical protein